MFHLWNAKRYGTKRGQIKCEFWVKRHHRVRRNPRTREKRNASVDLKCKWGNKLLEQNKSRILERRKRRKGKRRRRRSRSRRVYLLMFLSFLLFLSHSSTKASWTISALFPQASGWQERKRDTFFTLDFLEHVPGNFHRRENTVLKQEHCIQEPINQCIRVLSINLFLYYYHFLF